MAKKKRSKRETKKRPELMGRQADSWKAEMNSLIAQTTFQLFLPSPNPALKTHSYGMFLLSPTPPEGGG
jgi:hypothetical protein